MAFIKFTERNRVSTSRVSVNPHGLLVFSQGARRKFSLDQFTHCVLYYDSETQRIGIELTADASSEGASKLTVKQAGAFTKIKGFLNFFGILPTATISYEVSLGEADAIGWILIDLKTGIQREKRETVPIRPKRKLSWVSK